MICFVERVERCRRGIVLTILVGTVVYSGCTGRRLTVVGPVQDASTVATRVESETRVIQPLQIRFMWRLNESRQRHEGIGVARVEDPYLARLDLFTTDLETVVTAVLADGELRLPPGSREDILPPTDLMWGALGVVRPHAATLLGGDVLEGNAMRLRYAYPDGRELHYVLDGGRLRSAEVLDDGHVVERLELQMRDERYPKEARYRNLADFRELIIERETIEEVASFEPAIWRPAP